jgi:hypothetical protein
MNTILEREFFWRIPAMFSEISLQYVHQVAKNSTIKVLPFNDDVWITEPSNFSNCKSIFEGIGCCIKYKAPRKETSNITGINNIANIFGESVFDDCMRNRSL